MTWTAERRQRQSEAIRQWRPWEKSTGPVSAEGRQKVGKNAFKGGCFIDDDVINQGRRDDIK